MDDVDRRIIGLLRVSGRATYAQLARSVGLSAPAVHDRVSKLEAQGVITGYHADVDPNAVGFGVTALIGVYEAEHSEGTDIVAALREMPEVEDCLFVAGDASYMLKVRVQDTAQLERALMKINRLRGVSRTNTTVVLSTRWEGRVGGPAGEQLIDTPADPSAESEQADQ